MSILLQSEIPATAKRKLSLDPGVPLYIVQICNHQAHEVAVAISYDRTSGELVVIVTERH